MKINWAALVGLIAGGALVPLGPILGALFPKEATLLTTIFGGTGFVVFIAGLIVQVLQPSAKVTSDAVAVDSQGNVTGTNVTTTTTAPIAAPQKGP